MQWNNETDIVTETWACNMQDSWVGEEHPEQYPALLGTRESANDYPENTETDEYKPENTETEPGVGQEKRTNKQKQ